MKLPLSILACAGVLLAAASTSAPALAGEVGFARISVADGGNPPLEVGVWYPTADQARPTRLGLFQQNVAPGGRLAGEHLPLVVISHGNGGGLEGHYDTALALAEAGFVVAAPTHRGDNHGDQSHAADLAGRVRQLDAVIDFMIKDWKPGAVDPARVGAFGFSAGGFTVLAAAGGTPDRDLVAPHCEAHPSSYTCKAWATAKRRNGEPGPQTFIRDPNLRAIAVAAPALGFTFTKEGLADVTMPVSLWRAEDDEILPNPYSAEAVRLALPKPPEMHVVPHAGHFDFLAPCSDALADVAPIICVSEPGFDRETFHMSFDAEIVAFFTRALDLRPR